MKVGSLFSGIGGLDLGLERAGMEVVWQVEIDKWCQRVLAKHWPNVRRYGDIKEVNGEEIEAVDLIAGGFPCQPVSVAGKRKAQADSRWLWPEFLRIVSEVRPRLVLVENVPGLLHRGMAGVIGDLSACGYDAEWNRLSAAAVGAPHLRERVFIVAHSISGAGGGQRRIFEDPQGQGWGTTEAGPASLQSEGRQAHHPDTQPSGEDVANADNKGSQGRERRVVQKRSSEFPAGESGALVAHTQRLTGQDGQAEAERQGGLAGSGTPVAHPNSPTRGSEGCPSQTIFRPQEEQRLGRCGSSERNHWAVEPDVGRVAHGVPSRVDRLRGLGNAVVSQVAEWIGRCIMRTYS